MKLYVRIVDFDECNKLCIHDFSIWDHLGFGQSVFLKTNALTLVKLGQMTHLMT